MDPLFRHEVERDIAILADPEVELSFAPQSQPGRVQLHVVRRRGIKTTDPTFRFRSPDAA